MCKIVFIRKTFNGDTIIRGHLTDLAFAQLGLRCKSEVVRVEWFANLVKLNRTLTMAYNGHRKPWVAYFVKEAWLPEPDLAHLVGAYAVFDVIDRDKSGAIDKDELEHFLRDHGLPKANIDAMMLAADDDRSREIEFDEFRKSQAQLRTKLKDSREKFLSSAPPAVLAAAKKRKGEDGAAMEAPGPPLPCTWGPRLHRPHHHPRPSPPRVTRRW